MSGRRWCKRTTGKNVVHSKLCRPGRPLCRWRREEKPEKYGVCGCASAPFPHRRGWCKSGAAARYSNRKAYGPDPEPSFIEAALTAAEEDVFAFFDHPIADDSAA
jgi:hypothetical protein